MHVDISTVQQPFCWDLLQSAFDIQLGTYAYSVASPVQPNPLQLAPPPSANAALSLTGAMVSASLLPTVQ
jgi:hypothetical protein